MRAWLPIFAALALGATAPGSLFADAAGAPFLIQNENPVSRLFGPPAGDDAFGVAPTGFQARVTLDVANNSLEEARGDDRLVLDGETWVARILLRRGWKNGWRVAVQVPVVSHQGGVADGFIEDYHDALSLPQGNRERRPSGRLEYSYRRNGETRFNLTDSTAGLGDVRLSVSAPLWRDRAGTRAAECVAGVELPTGDSGRLLGSGSTDFSLGLAGCDRASLSRLNLELHGSAGLLVLTPGDVLEAQQEHVAGYGSFSLGWRLADGLRPRLQLDWHSPFFADIEPLDSWAVELVMGASVRLPRDIWFDLAVAEDLAVNTTPDVVFHFGLRREF